MPIFFDTTKRRKFYVRGIVVACLFLLALSLGLLLFNLAKLAQSHTPISYQQAIEQYHYYYSAANAKKVAITIDDGPHPPVSQVLMSALAQAHAPATFFYVGEHALARPDLVQQAAADGFDVGIHSFDHAYSVDSSYTRLAFELYSTALLLGADTGQKPVYYRPPYLLGIGIDPTINPYIPASPDMLWSLELGYLPVGSDIDPKDWLATSQGSVLQGLIDALQRSPNGHIILLHEDVNTGKEMPSLIAYLREQGYQIVPLSELLTPPTDIALAGTLKPGDTDLTTGGDVSKLQWFLYKEDYLDPYLLTGVFDSNTQTALENFQTQNGLKSSGLADASTRALVQQDSLRDLAAPAAVASAPAGLLGQVKVGMQSVLRSLYVHLFPLLSAFFVAVVYFTLLLVLVRMLLLVGLLVWQKRRAKKAAERSPHTCAPLGVSVIIPAYNEEENIGATVESALSTAHSIFEILVINDGSTDGTGERVRGVIAKHPQAPVRLIEVENGGKAAALNIGLREAAHDVIAVLDADAVLDPQALGYFSAHFADPAVGAVAGKVCTTGRRSLLDRFQALEYAVGQNIDKKALSSIGAVGVVPGPAGAWRKKLLLSIGGFHTDTLVEDQEMTLCVLRAGARVVYEPRALAYTETPHTLTNFLKQRFRWVYGTMQCFWKHKSAYRENPTSMLSEVVLPNILIYNILLPLTYPFADSALLWGIVFGQASTLLLPYLTFTAVDMAYAWYGIKDEPDAGRLMLVVPLQRVIYKWLLYYSVAAALTRALEGTGSKWNKFNKMGETSRFFFDQLQSAPQLSPVHVYQVMPEEVTTSFHGPGGTAEAATNLQEVMSLSVMPRHFQSPGDTSSPAFSPNVLTGFVDEPNTYAKSSSPFGPTSSH